MSGTVKGVAFGNTHTSTMGMYLSEAKISTPKTKEFSIDIPGSHGTLDMTEYFGEVLFDNRNLVFTFSLPQRSGSLMTLYSTILNTFNGKYFDRIILDDDPNHHYKGRVIVGDLQKGKINKITLTCDCKPFVFENTARQMVFSIPMSQSETEYPLHLLFTDDAYNSTFGDIDGDTYIGEHDREALVGLIGRHSFESESALRADLNMDGVVTAADHSIMFDFLHAEVSPTPTNLQAYVVNGHLIKPFCVYKDCDFGLYPTPVTFSVTDGNIRMWQLRVDNVIQYTGSDTETTVTLSGYHDILIQTTLGRYGSVTASFTKAVGY